MVKFNVVEKDEYVVVEFELDAPLTPEKLREIEPPKVLGKGVIISGRGPIWLYGFLIHYYHPATFVATFDPRLGAVVVESHTPRYRPGDVISQP